MQRGQEPDPVEEVTVQLGNLELTIKVRQLPSGSGASSSSGFELVPSVSRTSSVVLPIAETEPAASAAAASPPTLEQQVLDACSARELAALPLDFLSPLTKKLSAADRAWVPAARIARAYRAGLVARKHLDGEYCDKCSPSVPLRNTIYVVLRTPGFLTGFWTADFGIYQRLVINNPQTKNGFQPTSVSHAFPSRTEAEAFLQGARCPWPPPYR